MAPLEHPKITVQMGRDLSLSQTIPLDGLVERFRINWVWMPPWGPERITDDGRDMMRAIGFSI